MKFKNQIAVGAGFLTALAFTLAATASPATITIQADQLGAKINPAMWGIFFEDINFGADGGLYAELVKNRGFEFPDPLMGWIINRAQLAKGEVTVRDDAPFNAKNSHYVRVRSEGTGLFGLSNEGFRGMGVKAGETYDFSAQIRSVEGKPVLKVQLYGGDGTLLESVDLKKLSGDWQKYTATLHPKDTDPKARLAVLLDGRGTVDLDFVSLFPENTWKHRSGGLRADMVQALADLHPGFMRFPGGCIVEGPWLDGRYQWKKTIGPVEERPLLFNRWNTEFVHRPTPDYYQSFGLGFFEFFQLCEDIGASPLPILNCGMACEFNSGELCPLDQLQPYIQDALDLIEFANGDTNTVWGAQRAALGHPEPFHLKMLGVGNEQWGEQYFERYAKFAAAIKEKYPDIQLISASGPDPAGDRFNLAWKKLRELHADIIDEHCYAKPEWFFNNAHRYDRYDRTGPKVFMGEYAAQSVGVVSTKNRNNLETALAEAAYLTGLERNADVVRMASYAPLFANTEAWQWTPDLIWVDSLHVTPTPNYFVQQMFSCNRGDEVLPLELSGLGKSDSLYASAVKDDATGEVIVKVVNANSQPCQANLKIAGGKTGSGQVTVTVLASGNLADQNAASQPLKVLPKTATESYRGGKLKQSFPANSFTVLRFE
jgi:alpha-L-arabinofuranosidase